MISITDPSALASEVKTCGPAELQDDLNRHGLLRLSFHDIDRADTGLKERTISEEDGKSIIEFVERYQGYPIIVHCEAGRSRSAAVAAALDCIYNGDDTRWFNDPWYYPNMLVYRTVINAYQNGSKAWRAQS